MIQLTKDLFARLVISAKKFRKITPSVVNVQTKNYAPVKRVNIQKPIGQTIEEMVENSEIKALKKELDNAEEIFFKLKQKGENLDFLYRVENKLLQLRKMIDEKSYY
ncbi:TPA: hypothetical protein HA235_07705 [Candidatus Woesearchaeota archaeon]|nr:hypothetical protein [Candidatus Woesearchaeota archaeon]HIH32564.1 hypothetical protein [Candidatus Woesearchaeota archaeon]HIH54893.1 hypothetical protein [Candidatus Woesearchaeota archaeon]HIJ01748.1 hypothetical protein [Candidatus Woesearchaeota archaeon]HIJ13938.1 hypothetical protein [Candidatus Woesearchaeota archaeon]